MGVCKRRDITASFYMRNMTELINLDTKICECSKCDLCTISERKVLGTGDIIDTKIMFIGESPASEEIKSGIPFVGDAGKIFTEFLTNAGIDRKDVYITNAVKCQNIEDGRNLNPTTVHQEACREHLHKEIELLKPELIVTLGKIALTSLGIKVIAMKNFVNQYIEVKIKDKYYSVYPMYHPSYLKYNSKDKTLWENYKHAIEKLKTHLDIQSVVC